MKPRTISLISAFLKTIFYSVLIVFILFFLACFFLSCASIPTGEKVCKVYSKKCDKKYCDFTCITLFSNQKVYLSGFETDANVNDTMKVVVTKSGFNYFKK